MSTKKILTGAIIGAAVGTAIGYLFTTEKGAALRKKLVKGAGKLGTSIGGMAGGAIKDAIAENLPGSATSNKSEGKSTTTYAKDGGPVVHNFVHGS